MKKLFRFADSIDALIFFKLIEIEIILKKETFTMSDGLVTHGTARDIFRFSLSEWLVFKFL